MTFGSKILVVFVIIAFAATFAKAQNIPTIIVQPASQATAPSGTISFSVSASGAGTLAYQWAKNTTNLSNGTFSGRATVSGATTSTLTLTSITTNDQANYTCRITNSYGSITSLVASLQVYVSPTVTTQPMGQTNAVGSNVKFTVVASGSTPFTYQWQYNNSNIPTATLNVYTINNADTNDSGTYTVSVSNPAGTANSSAAQLLILAGNPPVIVQQPASVTTAFEGTSLLSAVVTSTVPIAYQWLESGNTLAGQTNATLTLTNIISPITGIQLSATNIFGGTLSSNASINVLYPFGFPSNLLQGLIAYYPFNGNAKDASGNNNNLTPVGNPSFVSGVLGIASSAISFNGSSYCETSGLLVRSNPFTWSLWVETTSLIATNFNYVEESGNHTTSPAMWCNINTNTSPATISYSFWTYGGGGVPELTSSYTPVNTNQWVHLVGVSDTTGVKSLYVNGVLEGTTPAQNFGQVLSVFDMGGEIGYSIYNQYQLGNVRVYCRALSSNEVGQLYMLESGNMPPPNLCVNANGNNSLQIQLSETPNYPVILQAATNLTTPNSWQPIFTNNTDFYGNWMFTDTNTILYPARYYRVMTP